MKKLVKNIAFHIGLAVFYGIVAYLVGVLLSPLMG